MSTKHFCLKWTRFQTNILSAFESLQTTEDLADVTLTCEGINIKAHKFILSACSPYFRTIFKVFIAIILIKINFISTNIFSRRILVLIQL